MNNDHPPLAVMQNIHLDANFDWEQIGEAGAVLRLMINKKKMKKNLIFHHFRRTCPPTHPKKLPDGMKNVHPLAEKSSITAPIEFSILKRQYGSHI